MKIHCKYDKLVPVSELKKMFHPENPNTHSKEQIEELVEQFKYQGIRDPAKVSTRSNYVQAGHGRIMAAIKAGLKEYPIVYQDWDDDTQEYAYLTADNGIASWAKLDLSKVNLKVPDLGPNFDIKRLAIPGFQIDMADKGQCDEDEVPEVKESFVKLGDIWQLGEHRLMCGDSTSIDAVEKLMGGEKADMVFTDPPYGVEVVKSGMVGAEFGVAKKGHYKEIVGDDTTDTAKEFYQTCNSIGFKNFILWGGNYFTDFLPPSKSWVIWNKRDKTDIKNTFADGEMAWSTLGHPLRIHGQLWNGMIRAGEHEKRVHPTQKPIALAEFCFDLLKNSKTIFDGFGGSGSTLIACEKSNRKCFMMELDTHYCGVIIERWQKYTGQKAERLNGKLQ